MSIIANLHHRWTPQSVAAAPGRRPRRRQSRPAELLERFMSLALIYAIAGGISLHEAIERRRR